MRIRRLRIASRYFTVAYLLCLVAQPLPADAFSLATFVEAHQERMQRRYELMSYRLCTAVSSLLPFVASGAWCMGEVEKGTRSADEDLAPGATELFMFENGTSSAPSLPKPVVMATTTVSSSTTKSE